MQASSFASISKWYLGGDASSEAFLRMMSQHERLLDEEGATYHILLIIVSEWLGHGRLE